MFSSKERWIEISQRKSDVKECLEEGNAGGGWGGYTEAAAKELEHDQCQPPIS